ncbi:RNA-binding protein pop5 [Recurvomyces mirabilis]|uniref:Ribonuclease P/MRP protein subunit POP5 n=1 Tax=Recurvomyces mirabilis TaxID=574656 RepID=A0AAE0WUP7_9PEZI|nr:RNA-binding protein pop5 [Recurvomyces mirabilis]KAK5160713.1 RNA-binding protein pop5 [Recurvomyces mirabilis]
MVRIKHRYLLVNILYPDPKTSNVQMKAKPGEDAPYAMQFRQPSSDKMDGKVLFRLIKDNVAELFGDYGSGKIAGSLQVKYFSQATSTAIIRVSRDHYRLVWSALTFTTRLPKPLLQPCVVQVVRVSGTIKKAEEEAIRRARIGILRAQRASKGLTGGVLTTRKPTNGAEAGAQAEADDDIDASMIDGIEDGNEPGDVDEDDGE